MGTLSDAEQAQLTALMTKAAAPDPDPVEAEPVIVVVEAPEPAEAPVPTGPPEPAETAADLVIAEAVADTIRIDAQAEASIRVMTAEHELAEQREERMSAELAEVIPDPTSILDDVLGPVEAALDPDSAPAPGHWFFRKLGGRK